MKLNTLAATIAALGLASPAFAHTGVGATHGFDHGFWHPLTGADHVLAMVAVGLFAANLGGRALWLVPATFVSVMAAAGAIGMSGLEIPFVETGIALSVLADAYPGSDPRGIEVGERALAIEQDQLGPDHPLIADGV